MSFDFSQFSAQARRIAHRAGRGDGDADRAADWIQLIVDMLGGGISVLNEYPISQYTAGGQALTNANFVQAFNDAVAACQAGHGGRVTIPAGVWDISSQLTVTGTVMAGDTNQVLIFVEGAGQNQTIIRYPQGYSGNGFYFQNGHWGGLRNLRITAAGTGASGKALTVDAVVGPIFENLYIDNFSQSGGAGIYCRSFIPNGNSQDMVFINIDLSANYNNFDVAYFMATMVNVKSNQALNRNMLIDSSFIYMYGGNLQGNSPIIVEIAGGGGSHLLFDGQYWEGGAISTLFKFGQPSITENFITVSHFSQIGSPQIAFDISPFNNVNLLDNSRGFDATTIVKARNANRPIRITNVGDTYENLIAKFDMDATSLTQLFYQNGGYVRQGGDHFVGGTYNLSGYAIGSEPAASDQALIFNTTTNVPRFRTGGSWVDLARADASQSLYDILAPYAVEIWDIGIASSLQSLTTPTTWKGLKATTTLNNGIVGKSPDVAASQRFRGQYGSTCTLDGGGVNSKYWSGTLGTGVASGKWPGVFAVFAASTTGTAGVPRTLLELKGTETFKVSFADNISTANTIVTQFRGFGVAIGSLDLTTTAPHVYYAGFSSGNALLTQIDAGSVVSGSALAAASTAMTGVTIGGRQADTTGSDITVLFLAILDTTVPPATILQAQRIAKQFYGIK
jgi:hypothetical protein